MVKAWLATAAAMTLAAGVGAAAPENPLARDKVVLDLRHIDFATVEGQRRLAIRMDQAARAVCGDRLDTVHLDMAANSRACQADVVADIRSRIEARAVADARPAVPVRLASR
jgi:UrcA family protein